MPPVAQVRGTGRAATISDTPRRVGQSSFRVSVFLPTPDIPEASEEELSLLSRELKKQSPWPKLRKAMMDLPYSPSGAICLVNSTSL